MKSGKDERLEECICERKKKKKKSEEKRNDMSEGQEYQFQLLLQFRCSDC